jgi:hypothetical protein
MFTNVDNKINPTNKPIPVNFNDVRRFAPEIANTRPKFVQLKYAMNWPIINARTIKDDIVPIAFVINLGISPEDLILPILIPYGIVVTRNRNRIIGIIPDINGESVIMEPVSGFLKKLLLGINAIINNAI